MSAGEFEDFCPEFVMTKTGEKMNSPWMEWTDQGEWKCKMCWAHVTTDHLECAKHQSHVALTGPRSWVYTWEKRAGIKIASVHASKMYGGESSPEDEQGGPPPGVLAVRVPKAPPPTMPPPGLRGEALGGERTPPAAPAAASSSTSQADNQLAEISARVEQLAVQMAEYSHRNDRMAEQLAEQLAEICQRQATNQERQEISQRQVAERIDKLAIEFNERVPAVTQWK